MIVGSLFIAERMNALITKDNATHLLAMPAIPVGMLEGQTRSMKCAQTMTGMIILPLLIRMTDWP